MKCTICGAEFEGNFCTNCGASKTEANDYNNYRSDKKSEKKKQKKPFYKKPVFLIIAVLVLIAVIGNIASKIKENKAEKIVWSEIELGTFLPEPGYNRGDILLNDDEELYVTLKKVDDADFKTYIEKCKEKGYTVDAEKDSYTYSAYNKDGYKLKLSKYSDDMRIELNCPMEFSTIQWPNSTAGKMLPAPKSLRGKFDYENEDGFSVYIGNTTIDDYNAYVNSCMESGFNVEYNRNDKIFSADNSAGYHVSLTYEGNNIIRIVLSAPDSTNKTAEEKDTTAATNTTTTATTTTTTEKKTENAASKGLRPDFKKAMDSYEKFMNEYVEFMKKYEKSGGTDLSLLTDYATYMSKYSSMCEDFEKWDEEDMNDAELAYYIDVQARVQKKLLEVAY